MKFPVPHTSPLAQGALYYVYSAAPICRVVALRWRATPANLQHLYDCVMYLDYAAAEQRAVYDGHHARGLTAALVAGAL
jgi:hypothetical protein